jgi:thymidylate synthase
MKTFYKPSDAIKWTKERLSDSGYVVKTERWQGIESPDDMWETMNHSFQFFIPDNIEDLIKEVKPNLEWADEHFEERVGGLPLNPPPSHVRWPFAQKNNSQFGGESKFSHTYPERIWPRYASEESNTVMKGIRFEYGDFSDVIDLLLREPFTRQAFLPIWFPEDTGSSHGERVPCTIGYHFMRRGDHFHLVYFIRSCDYIRHFRDDIYLSCRKLMWLLDILKERDFDRWKDVKPGYFSMHIVSLHCFNKEKGILKQSNI